MNDTFQVQILAASVWDPPKRATEGCLGYDVKASQKVILPVGRVTNLNLGMSLAPPYGATIIILPATGSLASKWSLYGRTLKSNSIGEALVAVKNNTGVEVVIMAGDTLGQIVLLPQESYPIVNNEPGTEKDLIEDEANIEAACVVETFPPGAFYNHKEHIPVEVPSATISSEPAINKAL